MSKDGILDWKHAIQRAAHYVRFLDDLEASLAKAGDVLYLRAGDASDGQGFLSPNGQEHPDTVSLKLRVLEWLSEGVLQDLRPDAAQEALLTHDGRPVYVFADHLTGDLWWVEINPLSSSEGDGEESSDQEDAVPGIAYIRGSRHHLPQ